MTTYSFIFLLIIFDPSWALTSCSAAQLRRVRTDQGELGRGVQGAVYRVSDTEVVKILELSPGDAAVAEAEREIQIMDLLKDFSFVAKFHESCEVSTDELKKIYIFMEKCEMELTDYLKGVEHTVGKFYEILLHLVRIFYEINARGIYHIDNQPGNVMVCGGQLKLIDFGRGVVNKNARNKKQLGYELMNMAGLFMAIRKEMGLEIPELDPLFFNMKEQGILSRRNAALTLNLGNVREKLNELACEISEGSAAVAAAPIRRFIAEVAGDTKRSIFSKYALLTKVLMPEIPLKAGA